MFRVRHEERRTEIVVVTKDHNYKDIRSHVDEAFNEQDAREYIGDIFNIDDEIKSVNITKIQEK